MTALVESVLAGVIVSLFNRFIMSRNLSCFPTLNQPHHHQHRNDNISSQTTAINDVSSSSSSATHEDAIHIHHH